jgi:flagellar biosynthesis/type III secretory pathway chaperone
MSPDAASPSQTSPTAGQPAALLLQCAELTQLLEMEFEALKLQELDRFEQIQTAKTRLLTDLSLSCPPAQDMQDLPEWAGLREALSACRDLHRRNAVLIERKLEAIRSALHSLSAAGSASPVEVYDRLGHVSRFNRARGYHEA